MHSAVLLEKASKMRQFYVCFTSSSYQCALIVLVIGICLSTIPLAQCSSSPNPVVLKDQAINGSCSKDRHCGKNAYCIDSTCKCEFGCKPMPNRIDCTEILCFDDSECRLYDANARCDRNNWCTCQESYKLDKKSQKCVGKYSTIGNDCSSAHDCGNFTVCVGPSNDKMCVCKMGFEPHVNQMDCLKKTCSYDYECGQYGGARCDAMSNQCVCKPNYQIEPYSQKCIKSAVEIGAHCTANYECGSYTVCGGDTYSTCRCRMGYSAASNNVDCTKVTCSRDSDCRRFVSAKCANKSCVCESSHTINPSTQECYYTGGSDNDAGTFAYWKIITIAIVSGLVLIICIATLCVCCCLGCCCCKKRPKPVPNHVVILDDQMLNRNPAFVSAGTNQQQVLSANQLYPELYEPPPPYNPNYVPQQNLSPAPVPVAYPNLNAQYKQ